MEGEVVTKEQRKAARQAAKAAKAEKRAEKAEKKQVKDQKREQKAQKRKEREEKKSSKSSEEKSPKKQKTENSSASMEVEAPAPVAETPSKKRGRDNSNGNTLEHKRPKTAVDPALVRKFREENNISVSGDIPYWPIFDFAEAGFSADILNLTSSFTKPTPIQSQCWPILLANRDTIGIAETGSGKTLSFGLPGLQHIKKNLKSRKPCMLVVAPTRELAQQNHDVLSNATKFLPGLKTICIYGGVPSQPQIQSLREGVQLVVGCPGRILDLANQGHCDLSGVDFIVLDEADRMLDMGFEKDIRKIFELSQPKGKRQTVMFSATWPDSVQRIAQEYLNDPVRVTIGSEELSANTRIVQIVEVIEMDAREKRLFELLQQYHAPKKEKVLVFALYKKEAARLENILQRRRYNCVGIHGDMSAPARAQALESFKSGDVPILVATDVAARGLHIPKVAYVINFSFPLTVEDYVHRIGRTGRAGATGISHTFFHKFDKGLSGELIGVLKKAGQEVPQELLAFGTAVKKKEPVQRGKIDVNHQSNRITFDSDEDD